jgi:dephospho-CoA kinase
MKSDIVISGRFGAGKTTLARATAASLGGGYAGFGATIKRIALERSLPITREYLQALGEQLVRERAEELCRRVIAEREALGAARTVIDGLRHKEVYEILRRLSEPKRLLCIFIDLPDDLRIARIKAREALSDSQISQIDHHSTEIQVGTTIRSLADITVDNSKSIQSVADEIVSAINQRE